MIDVIRKCLIEFCKVTKRSPIEIIVNYETYTCIESDPKLMQVVSMRDLDSQWFDGIRLTVISDQKEGVVIK